VTDDWRERLNDKMRKTLELSADLMAAEQRLDEHERRMAELPKHPDPVVQGLIEGSVLQLRSNHHGARQNNLFNDVITELQAAVLELGERVAALEHRLDS
jgi:hypothetical protein